MRKNKYIKSYSDNFFLLSYSDLFRVSIDPRVKPEGDERGRVPEGDERGRVPKGDERGRVPKDDGLNDVNSMFLGIFLQSIKIGMTILFCLLSTTVHAACTLAPDCVELGYTASSCDGGFVRCPFDTSKLFCIPCDNDYKYSCSGNGYDGGKGTSCDGKYIGCNCSSGYEWRDGACSLPCATSYQYICSGTGYSNGSGTSCGGKYTSCNCIDGYEWKENACIKQECDVGMIFYSDNTCSTIYDNSKTAIGIVVEDNELIVALTLPDMVWGGHGSTITALTSYTDGSKARTDYNGKENTAIIVEKHTSSGLTASKSAAIYCNSYSTERTNAGDWYLPAAGEVNTYIISQYNIIEAGWNKVGTTISDYYFWSSSQDGYNAWNLHYSSGLGYSSGKGSNYLVSCFLNISK